MHLDITVRYLYERIGHPASFLVHTFTSLKILKIFTGDLSKGELGVTAVPGKEDQFKADLHETIDYAKALGARKIHIMAGKLDLVTPKNWETYESNLKYAADVLKKDNLVGVIEPINQHSVPKYFLSDYNKGWFSMSRYVIIIIIPICESLKRF